MKTQVVIIGAGPAGLLLDICCVRTVLNASSLSARTPIIYRVVRAGALERTTTDLFHRLGVDKRLNEEGLREDGFCLADGDTLIRIDTYGLTGKHVTVYGQTEVTRDLMNAAPARGLEIIYEAGDVALHEIVGDASYITFTKDGVEQRIDARFLAGCDGFHGPSRKSIPQKAGREYNASIRLAGLASWTTCHHVTRNLFTPTTNAGLPLPRCGPWGGAVIISTCR